MRGLRHFEIYGAHLARPTEFWGWLHDPSLVFGHVGFHYRAFGAPSREPADVLTQQVRERGLRIVYADRHPFAGGATYYANDSEGPNRIKVEGIAP